MRVKNFKGIALSICMLSYLGLSAQDKGALPLDKAVRTGKLANGFTYYIRHNEEPKNRVTLYLVNKVGSILETDNQRGLAHFMEHMSFNGTKHFPKDALVDYLEKSGVRFGADLNAYTSYDETVYQLPLPTDKPGVMKNGIQIMRDWAQEATLDPVEINKERGVVLEEKRLGKGADERMRVQYYPVILNQSRYTSRLPIGTDEVLNNFKPETIKRFYHDWYRPNLQALIVVGDVDVNQMEQTIKAKFSDLKNPANEKPRTRYTIPLTGKNHFIAVTDKEQTATEFQVLIKSQSLQEHTAADYRNMIIRALYNSMLGSRYRELGVKADPDFLQGGASIGSMIANLDYFNAVVTAKPNELERGVKAVWREVERAKRYGFTTAELERAKINYLAHMEAGSKEKNTTQSASFANEYVQYFLKGVFSPGVDMELELVRKDLPGISLADVNDLNEKYIKTTDRDILITAPDKDKNNLPGETKANSWLTEVEKENLKPYDDGLGNKSLFTVAPIPGKITAEEKDEQLNTTTLTLSNGVKVVLKPTNFKNNQIIFNGFSEGGTSLYSDADYQSASVASSVVNSGGVGSMNVIQLNKYLTGKQANAGPFINERTQGISGSAQPEDLETALQLTYAYFTEPRKDAEIFAGNMSRSRANLINKANDKGPSFQDTLISVLGNYNIRRTPLTLEKLDRINLDRAFEIYKERFADASGFTFTFVGSFDVNSIKPLLEKYLGSLPALHKNEKAVDLNIHAPEGRIEKTVYKGKEPKADVWLYFHGKYNYNQENDINMDALKETLKIRLLERLREDEGGVYAPTANFSGHKTPEWYTISVHFGCAPENVDKLIASTMDEIRKLKESGPLQVNLDKFKAEDLRSLELDLKSNSFWLGYLTRKQQEHGDLHQIFNYTKTLDKVTTQTIQARAKEYLSGKNYIRLVLLPENNQ